MTHQNNHLVLSRLIGDTVSSASTNGVHVTSAERNDFLNLANDMLIGFVLAADPTRKAAKQLLSELINSTSLTYGSGPNVPSDYIDWIEVQYGTTILEYDPSVAQFLTGRNPFVKKGFCVQGGGIIAIYDGAVIPAINEITLYYIKSDQTADSTESIALNQIWATPLVMLAAHLFFAQRGDLQRSQALHQLAYENMKSLLNAATGKVY